MRSFFVILIIIFVVVIIKEYVPLLRYSRAKSNDGNVMKKVVIYTTSYCPYCVRAKGLFDRKQVQYEEINVENDPALKEVMIKRAGGRKTVPQIFIGDFHVGGCDDLYELESQGKLDGLLP